MKVLVLCDGNICRSPMAAAYLRARAVQGGLAHVVIDSAGLLGIEGAKAAPHAITVAKEAGLDLTSHRSRGVTTTDVRTAEVILVMTLAHLETLDRRFPGGEARRLLIRSFEKGPEPLGGAPELADPVLGPLEEFRETFAVLRTCIDHLVLWLRHAA